MIEITGLASATGPLTKRISLSPEGKLISDGSACVMGRGFAKRVRLNGMVEFAQLIGSLDTTQAIALGALRADLPEKVEITTARRLAEMNGSAPPGLISRTAGHINYSANRSAVALLDYDTKGMPNQVTARLRGLGGFWAALVSVAPDLASAARVVRRSTSSGIVRSDTGEALPGSDGVHVYLLVQDGGDIERFLKTLHDRCWLHGLGWMMVGAGGQYLERSIVDRMVFAAERLVFEGAPILHEPLVQDAQLRRPTVDDGEPLDTAVACRALTVVEQAALKDLKAAERHRLAGPIATSRAAFVKEHGARIAARTGVTQAAAEQTVERQCGGVLLPPIELPFDAEEMAGCTVGDVLADPARFVGATLGDPHEGIAYGRCKAKVMQRADGSLWINSFAHGRIAYELKHDAGSVEAAIMAADSAEAANVLVRMLLVADLGADDEQRLKELASKLSEVKARPLGAKIKSARAEQARARGAEERDRHTATRKGGRIRLPAPMPDAERLPVLYAMDEVLCGVHEPEPPMRDMDGDPVEVRTRSPINLHELNSIGANQAETRQTTRLPAPEMPLLSKHDRFSMAHLVERYIEYEAGGSETTPPRAVALPQGFVDHFMAFRESGLPRVGGVVTAPLVLADGRMLATQGIDVPRKLVFRIPPQLLRLVDDIAPPAQEQEARMLARDRIARALDFLVNDWLCDVATSFAGKCILITLALTILERVLLPERPAFFVTAGKRGGGKTTALAMVILAVTGKKPAAAAWSFNEEERRKALVAYLSEGLAAMVFDNVPLGTTISCPTVEKILTAETYSDRVLGQSATMTVQAFTILSFTGNNIGPKGDLASRSLTARLNVDQADPENREFRHADPIAFTIDHRGKILRALYTILRGNDQLREPQPAKTRFKAWWHLVGSAVEHAANCLVEREVKQPVPEKQMPAKLLDFGAIFREVEDEDEEATSLGDVLEALHDVWPTNYFTAAAALGLIENPKEGEASLADRVKAFFKQNSSDRSNSDLSAMKIGRRLGLMLDAPIDFEGKTLKLVRKPQPETPSKRRDPHSFIVRVIA